MRRKLIQKILPLLFILIPILGAAVIAIALEPMARAFYIEHITWMDVVILSLGSTLFVLQMLLAYRALRWKSTGFDERPDPWLSHLAQGAEWFPLLGLLGTVAGILQTFSTISDETRASTIIARYAPAITATGSGLFMALINIFPTWVVNVGRDLIVALGGGDTPAISGSEPLASESSNSRGRSGRSTSGSSGKASSSSSR